LQKAANRAELNPELRVFTTQHPDKLPHHRKAFPMTSNMTRDMTNSSITPAPETSPASDAHPNQFALLKQRRFAPFFWTQFSGAANDNLFKFAFTVMVTYQLQIDWLPPAMAGLAIGALFILPFLLFSATAGQLTDKYDKTRVIQLVKSLEIAIMLLAAWGFWTSNVFVLLGCVFDGPAFHAVWPGQVCLLATTFE
jgi:hypothetical protein